MASGVGPASCPPVDRLLVTEQEGPIYEQLTKLYSNYKSQNTWNALNFIVIFNTFPHLSQMIGLLMKHHLNQLLRHQQNRLQQSCQSLRHYGTKHL